MISAILYFIGLIIVVMCVGSLTNSLPIGYLVIGFGFMIASTVAFMHKDNNKRYTEDEGGLIDEVLIKKPIGYLYDY